MCTHDSVNLETCQNLHHVESMPSFPGFFSSLHNHKFTYFCKISGKAANWNATNMKSHDFAAFGLPIIACVTLSANDTVDYGGAQRQTGEEILGRERQFCQKIMAWKHGHLEKI